MLENSNTLETPSKVDAGRARRLGRLNLGDHKVRRAIPDIAKFLVDKTLEGDMRAAELVHRYYIQPQREARDAKRAARASRSTSALPASVTASLTRFRATLVEGETLALPAQPPVTVGDRPPSVTVDATLPDDAPPALVPDPGQAAQAREAGANPGGGQARAWDPSRPLLALEDHTNGAPLLPPAPLISPEEAAQKGLKLCERCGHPITDRKKVNRAHFCRACAEAGRKHSLAESAKRQAERRAQRKLQEEHDAKGPRQG